MIYKDLWVFLYFGSGVGVLFKYNFKKNIFTVIIESLYSLFSGVVSVLYTETAIKFDIQLQCQNRKIIIGWKDHMFAERKFQGSLLKEIVNPVKCVTQVLPSAYEIWGPQVDLIWRKSCGSCRITSHLLPSGAPQINAHIFKLGPMYAGYNAVFLGSNLFCVYISGKISSRSSGIGTNRLTSADNPYNHLTKNLGSLGLAVQQWNRI